MGAFGKALIVKTLADAVPVIPGVLLTTRIKYPVPLTVAVGIVAEIVPAKVDVNVPIAVGVPHVPVELDNCAVKTFPDVNVPTIVNGTETAAPAQKGEPVMVPVVIV